MRKISLDIETTGLFFYEGHKIIEIGCVEILNDKITDNIYNTYINPLRDVEKEASEITGITYDFLKDKPKFCDIVDDFFNFLDGSDEIIIHNASFDVNFINNELRIMNYKIKNIQSKFNIFDTLNFARKNFPGKKNSLNALCERYNIECNDRVLHGAVVDAKLLANVYLKMTNEFFIYNKAKNNSSVLNQLNKTVVFKTLESSYIKTKNNLINSNKIENDK